MKMKTKKTALSLFGIPAAVFYLLLATANCSAEEGNPPPQTGSSDARKPVQGRYFAKKEYQPAPLPKFETAKDKLPSPIFDENPV